MMVLYKNLGICDGSTHGHIPSEEGGQGRDGRGDGK